MSGDPAATRPTSPNAGSAGGSDRRARLLLVLTTAASLSLFGATVAAADAADPASHDDAVAAAPPSSDPTGSDAAPASGTGSPTPPDDLGDDPELDALADACFDGTLLSCDLLYLQSPVDSAYEEYGDTCGGRQEPGTGKYCQLGDEGATPAPTTTSPTGTTSPPDTTTATTVSGQPSGEPTPPEGLGDDPELDALAATCYEGDMASCDDLYFAAEEDSQYKAYGDTCAGRQPERTGNLCVNLESPVPGTTIAGPGPTTSPPVTTVPASSAPASTAAATTAPATTAAGTVSTTAPATTSDITPATTTATSGSIPAPTLDPTGLGADPALDQLAVSCHAGDMAACDDLFRASESGSAYAQFADTCAGRQPQNTNRWCVDAFPGGPVVSAPTTTPAASLPASTVPVPTPPVTSSAVTTVPVPTVSLPPLPSAPTVPGATIVPSTTVPGVIPPATIEPTGLGTDPALDQLAVACYGGDMASCDQLWSESAIDSAYQDYGDTCAGRQPLDTGSWCTDSFPVGAPASTTTPGASTLPGTTLPGTSAPGAVAGLPAGQPPTGLGTDPGLDRLAQECFQGNMQSCDDLFDTAPVGSPYQSYGDTCGGRQAEGTFKYCRAAFPQSTTP